MSNPLKPLIYGAVALAVIFGTLPLVVSALRGDSQRVDRLLDRYEKAFFETIDTLNGVVKDFKRK